MQKKAIVFASVYFNSKIKVGSHHYAEALKKDGYDVLYVSYPISLLHYLFWYKVSDKERLKNRLSFDEMSSITYFTPLSLIPILNIFPLNSFFLIKKWLLFSDFFFRKSIRNFSYNVDLIWSESAFYIEAINRIKKKKSVTILSRLADNVLAFNNFPKFYFKALNELFSISDKIIISANSLREVVNPLFHHKLVWLPNAINLQRLESYPTDMPIEYIKDAHLTKLVYVGAIEEWFDWELIFFLSKNLIDASIYIIGPINHNHTKKDKIPDNIFLLGPKEHIDIGKYLANACIGIIPFKRNNLIDFVDPIKYYEYSFFNIPTVCTHWKEVSNFKTRIYLARTPKEFLDHINNLKGTKNNSHSYKIDLQDRDWFKNLKKVV